MSGDILNTQILKNCENLKIGIAFTLWNREIIEMLKNSAEQYFKDCGITNIVTAEAVGAWELIQVSKKLQTTCDGVLALGTLIKGDTFHFELIAESATHGLMELNLSSNTPVAMGILATSTYAQAEERANPLKLNKGKELAFTLLHTIKQVHD
ncbi:MAG: 6,7-dimethyl-8-ribityllumazine synthase [Gammaproteobacteria bacterium]